MVKKVVGIFWWFSSNGFFDHTATKYCIPFENTKCRIDTSHITKLLLWQVKSRAYERWMEHSNKKMTLWPWPLTYELDVGTWCGYFHLMSRPKSTSVCQSVYQGERERRLCAPTHIHTHIPIEGVYAAELMDIPDKSKNNLSVLTAILEVFEAALQKSLNLDF